MAQTADKMAEIDSHICRRFDIQKRLGKGAYGIVWKAIDRKTKEVVAIKKIFDAFRNQTDAQRTFREVMLLQSFKGHPNIVKLHSIHRAANNRDIYLGFEYMDVDLHNVIKRRTVLKDIHKKYIMYQLFKAIKYIHSGNVIHRDLKPSNILLDSDCRCKIADFGLARCLTRASELDLTEGDPALTDYVATRWYRAPEILIASTNYTKGIDMWSLGCILAEMAIGRPLFPGTSTVNQIERIMSAIPPPTYEDIHQVCVTGLGSSMIKNAASVRKASVQQMMAGQNAPNDIINLIQKLLVFNPLKRLTAEEALEHECVARFRNPSEEITMPSRVIIPLNDDKLLPVSEYRDKLYEMMSYCHQSALHKTRKSYGSTVLSRVTNCTEKYIRSHISLPEKVSQSEPKILNASVNHRSWLTQTNNTNAAKLESKFSHTQGSGVLPRHKPIETYKVPESRPAMKANTEIPKTRLVANRIAQHTIHFNSYNKNHGIITQSALMELREGTR